LLFGGDSSEKEIAIASKIKIRNAKKLNQKINKILNYYFLKGEITHQPTYVAGGPNAKRLNFLTRE
jgi:hypothetical protein